MSQYKNLINEDTLDNTEYIQVQELVVDVSIDATNATTVGLGDTSVLGNISVTGTVNGRNIGADGTQLDTNTSAITSLDSRVTTTENEITNIETDVTAVDSRLTTAENDITNIETDVTALDTRLTTAEGDITSLETDVTNIDGRLTTAEGDITSLETDVIDKVTGPASATNNAICFYDGTTGKLIKNVSHPFIYEDFTTFAQLSGQIYNATQAITSPYAQISQIQQDTDVGFNSFFRMIISNELRVPTINAHITATGVTIESVLINSGLVDGRNIGADGTQLDTNTADIASLDTRLGTAESDITSLEGRMTTVEGDVTSLEGRMTTVEGDVTSLEGRMTTVESDITSLEGRMTTVEADVSTNTTDITDLQNDKVEGPASATNNAVCVYNGTTGKLIQNSTVTISSGVMSVERIIPTYKHSACLRKVVAQTFSAGGYTRITGSWADFYDYSPLHSMCDAVNSRIYCRKTGVYRISATGLKSGGNGAHFLVAYVNGNGYTNSKSRALARTDENTEVLSGSTVIDLTGTPTSGDYVELYVYNYGTTSFNYPGGSWFASALYFSMELILE